MISPSTPAAVRLMQSRDAMRKAMLETTQPQAHADARPTASDGLWLAVTHLLQAKPGANLLAQTLQQLWARSTWGILARSTEQAAGILLTPIAQRNPIKLMATAFAIGSLLYLIRPWRLLTKSGVLAAVLGR